MKAHTTLATRGAEKLRQYGWLADRPAEFQAAILEATTWLRAAPGEHFIDGLEEGGGLYAIADGIAEVSFFPGNLDGRARYYARECFWAGQRPLLGLPRTLTLTARAPVIWALVPLARLRQLLAAEPAWWEQIAHLSEENAERACWAITDLSTPDSRLRVAGVLLQLAGCRRPQDRVRPPMSIELPQSDIAEMAAMSRSTLSKILAEFTAKGWIETCYTRLEVRDSAQLLAVVNGAAA